MIRHKDQRMTAKQFVQSLLIQQVRSATNNWCDLFGVNWEELTDKEKQEINDQFDKLEPRILKLLGLKDV